MIIVRSVAINITRSQAADTFSQTEVAGSRYSISREVRKNGKDTYTINGIACDRGKVTDQLRKDGIDLDHNRFLILQVRPALSLSHLTWSRCVVPYCRGK